MADPRTSSVRIRSEIASLPPYRQGKPSPVDGFKLSSNELPFATLPEVTAAIAAAAPANLYPDATAGRLRSRLGEKFSVDPDDVIVGAGSVALLAAFIQTVAGPGDEVISSWRSFEAYPGLVLVAGATHVGVPNTADGRHDLDAMEAAVTDRTRCILLCTPNNPTGPILTAAQVEQFVAAIPDNVLILLDEAYAEFVTDPEAVDGLAGRIYDRHPNVVVLRTFSKAWGLAGLRVGYAIGHRSLIDAARSTLIPLSVTASAEAAALASLDHEATMADRVATVVASRERLVAVLRDAGWPVPEAQGNFVWLPDAPQHALDALDAAKIVARVFPDGVRISVGNDRAVDAVIAALTSR